MAMAEGLFQLAMGTLEYMNNQSPKFAHEWINDTTKLKRNDNEEKKNGVTSGADSTSHEGDENVKSLFFDVVYIFITLQMQNEY